MHSAWGIVGLKRQQERLNGRSRRQVFGEILHRQGFGRGKEQCLDHAHLVFRAMALVKDRIQLCPVLMIIPAHVCWSRFLAARI